MTDTLREGLVREVRISRLSYDGTFSKEEAAPIAAADPLTRGELASADAAIAYIARWALEPAQVERAAKEIWPRRLKQENARAAIAALFEVRT